MFCALIASSQVSAQNLAPDSAPLAGASNGLIETPNPGFEAAYIARGAADANAKGRVSGEIAPGWEDNSEWADVEVGYRRETGNPHRGGAAQQIDVKRVSNGAMQFVQKVDLRRGRIQKWSIWMRGRAGSSVTLSIRQAGAPYAEYAIQTANLAAEWGEFRVFGVIPEDTPGFLMVRATSPQTLWIDDSALRDLTSAKSEATPRVGNLIPGGGNFEAGTPYGWSVRYEGDQGFQPLDPRPQIEAKNAAIGQKSLRCAMPVGSDLRVASPLLHLNYGRAHSVSFWAKASAPGTDLKVNLERAFDAGFTLDTAWKRFTYSGSVPFLESTRLLFRVPQTGAANTIWLDGIGVEESGAASPAYLAPEAVELSLNLPFPGHVLLGQERGEVRFETAGNLPKGAKLQLSALDLSGKKTILPLVSLSAKSFVLPAMNAKFGTWKLRALVVDSAKKPLSAPYELVWARLPAPRTIEAKNSYFGLHFPLSPYYFQVARRIGVRRTRLHDTSMVGKWNAVEAQKDVYRFYDAGIDAARASGIEVLGMLDGAPAWTTTKPREGGYWGFWNIPDKEGAKDRWDNYVTRVVGHFRGRIDSWEVWNEPWGAWWQSSGNPSATPELYGELSRRAYLAAKAANPGVQILGIDTYPGSAWTELALPHAPPAFYDGFSYHEYNDALFGGPNPTPVLRRREFLGAQAKYGVPKPLWNTEGGLFGVGSWLAPETGGMSVAQQPAYIVRYDVTQMAAEIRASFLYAMHTDPVFGDSQYTTSEYDRSVKPILSARAVLASLVDGRGIPTRSEPVPGVDFYTFPGAKTGEQISVAWSYDGQNHALTIPRGAQVLDVWGNRLPAARTIVLSAEPVYIVR